MNCRPLQVENGVARVVLDQPSSRVNILGRDTWADLEHILRQLAQSRDWRGLIIASGKPGIFVAGADLKELVDVPDAEHAPTREFIESGLRTLGILESLPFPTVACIDGMSLGGGLELALACDYRLGGTHERIKLGFPEVGLGLIPGWGGTQRLPRLVGPVSAIEMMLERLQLDAETAQYRGLIARIVPSENLLFEAEKALRESAASEDWKRQRDRKTRPLGPERSSLTIDDMNEGAVSDAKLFAMSLNPETFESFRQAVKNGPQRNAALAVLDVVEKGCPLNLNEGIALETAAFLRLAASTEAKSLIQQFFAGRTKN